MEREEFSELLKFTLTGYILGLSLGVFLDGLDIKQNPFGEWAVRTLSGEGESLFEGIYALKSRLVGAEVSMAEAYGWGKLMGMVFPWVVDLFSRLLGVNVYGVEGFYIPYFYALSDQIGANISGFLFLLRRSKSLKVALRDYIKNPVMLTSLGVVLFVPLGLLVVRFVSFSPTTNLYVALETIAANLCWLPPLVGWLYERKEVKG
ncbi:MAG: hypothetical protein ACK42C_02405 [Aquificaceae bacterium]|jgi:hypothetical protein|uniref:hypothetical protein n=1 Tax=Hydrogenobacter sp. Uz 6-8 TaxID=3384828 RepID=UPI000F2DBB5B|nr:MAG: hypothetical protein D6804_03825 [Aquificota bacterium]